MVIYTAYTDIIKINKAQNKNDEKKIKRKSQKSFLYELFDAQGKYFWC